MTLEIVAHRGAQGETVGNTVASFQRALDLGADAVELDVRLTREGVPVVHHYFHVDQLTRSRPIFALSLEEVRAVRLGDSGELIPTLLEILDGFAGRIGLEIEIKGPEPESANVVGNMLRGYGHDWETMEVTSYEPTLLASFHESCPEVATDLLLPRPEPWMGTDVMQHLAIHRARLAHARGVHLHPSQLSRSVVAALSAHGLEVHAWDVNDARAITVVTEAGVTRLCTDKLQEALDFRRQTAAPGVMNG